MKRKIKLVLTAAAIIIGVVSYIQARAYKRSGNIRCSDFSTHAQAQAYYEAQLKGYQSLDGHPKNGVACEVLLKGIIK